MLLAASRLQATARRHKFVTPTGATTFVSTYIGTNKMELLAQGRNPAEIGRGAPGPMAYLVEQAPDSTVDAHFHEVPQFQIFVGGTGRIGTHSVDGLTIHYAGAHSPYGPIIAGGEGVQYLTLRHNWDGGAQWMPGAAPVLRNMAGRKHVAFTSPTLEACGEIDQLKEAVSSMVLDPLEGAGAWRLQAGPGVELPEVAAPGASRFWYVLAGTVHSGAGELDAGSCLFASGSETGVALQGGAGGVDLILVRFLTDLSGSG